MMWSKFAVVAAIGVGSTAAYASAQMSRDGSNVVTFRHRGSSYVEVQQNGQSQNCSSRVIVYKNEQPSTGFLRHRGVKPKAIIHIPVPEKFRKQRKKYDNFYEFDLKVALADKR